MNNRWKMNRIGFVNFWLYDEEDFEFVDGKLLLRGQNGSGKSITTQSFIPFVLDGDRTPSRLDPFGSSDRRMEYYFLGEDGKDESTGYLYLEFKKDNTDEYRTIGIGQRAKRGKAMDFWGFVLSDNRRIGYDIWLYKEVGTSRLPYDKRELKALLGEQNFFTDSQSDYKKHVNRYIFGFRKEEQYELFIRLLVKVRAPKLSKEFKPTKVYDILNDSLQTLTDEDLRAMVDAMEKMDEIQDSLDMLNRAFADVKIIRNEYTRYNQYMLAKKAENYLNKKEFVETAQKQVKALEIQQTDLNTEQQEITERIQNLTEHIRLLETEKSGLVDTDLEAADLKLSQAKKEKEEAIRNEQRWDAKIQEYKEKIWSTEQLLKELEDRLALKQGALKENKEYLDEQQEELQWDQHDTAVHIIQTEQTDAAGDIQKNLELFRKLVEECRRTVQVYAEISRQYDEAASQLENATHEQKTAQQNLENAQAAVLESIDQWITKLFAVSKTAKEWKPERQILETAEYKIREYTSVEDAEAIQGSLRGEYERLRLGLTEQKQSAVYEHKLLQEKLDKQSAELAAIREQKELEPERSQNSDKTRLALEKAGITAIPFYKAVEFSEKLEASACARLEAQLESMGILDALVISDEDMAHVKSRCPGFLDTVLHVEKEGNSSFSALECSTEIPGTIQTVVRRILSNIYEREDAATGIYIGEDGCFYQGILSGKANKAGQAEYVGAAARRLKREQKIAELEEEIHETEKQLEKSGHMMRQLEGRIETLQNEYRQIPGFTDINLALDKEKNCSLTVKLCHDVYVQKKAQEEQLAAKKNQQYQSVLQKCKAFPYGRTVEAYDEVLDAVYEYQHIWQEVRQLLLQISTERANIRDKEDRRESVEQELDTAFVEKRGYATKSKECEIQIQQLEEYLESPEIKEKAARLKKISADLTKSQKESNECESRLAVLTDRLQHVLQQLPQMKEKLQKEIGEETRLRTYFEEELALKLVIDKGSRTLDECGKEAVKIVRDSDKNREAAELLQSLYQVYQRHNGSLASYGTLLEDCFQTLDHTEEISSVPVLRRRVRVASVWNGKKVYLEEFYNILRTAIEETELLIQKKDRELFEDILSQTVSQQLTDRIAESKKWVADMSKLMREMDTSMGLSFSLDWKPRKAENDTELDTAELEQILLRDSALLTLEDIDKVAMHFRSKIRMEKLKLEEDGSVINYMDLVRDALDYRKWFEFQMYFKRGDESRKPLTNAAFNRFSGGEKAMAMYVPLFAAVNAQYKKAENEDHPRMIALDEAFAGVDDKNISSMFALVHKLDFDYIMNSQALWGCFDTVKGLRIAELLRPLNSQTVSVLRYTWNGHERILDEQ